MAEILPVWNPSESKPDCLSASAACPSRGAGPSPAEAPYSGSRSPGSSSVGPVGAASSAGELGQEWGGETSQGKIVS